MALYSLYFSATGATENVCNMLAEQFAQEDDYEWYDFTHPEQREKEKVFTEEDLVVLGVPVYAGRVPQVLLPFLQQKLKGNNALAVAVVTYGNRAYEDALLELVDLLEAAGFRTVAAAAFIGEHSFSNTLAAGRPDMEDLDLAANFADQIMQKLDAGLVEHPVTVSGHHPYRQLSPMRDANGEAIDPALLRPVTSEACIHCGICADACPMNSIDRSDLARINGACLRCNACVKRCPVGAKAFTHPALLQLKQRLEQACTEPKKPELFL